MIQAEIPVAEDILPPLSSGKSGDRVSASLCPDLALPPERSNLCPSHTNLYRKGFTSRPSSTRLFDHRRRAICPCLRWEAGDTMGGHTSTQPIYV